MSMTEPFLLIMAAGNFGLAIMGWLTSHIVAASVVLELWLAHLDEAQASGNPGPAIEACLNLSLKSLRVTVRS
jgi:hypothetical protein